VVNGVASVLILADTGDIVGSTPGGRVFGHAATARWSGGEMSGTLIQIFLDSVQTYRKPAQFMRRAGGGWESIPAERALQDVQNLALGLASLGIEHGDRVGLLSENRYEWALCDLATLSLGAVTVPIYPTLTPDQCAYMLRDAGAKVVIVSNERQYGKLQGVRGQLPKLASLIAMDTTPPDGSGDLPFAEVMRRGAELRRASPEAWARHVDHVRPEDLATIIYTSGTTGEPKGAMLLHSNISSNVDAALKVMKLTPDDLGLSFLPLCHIFERMGGFYAMLQGGVTIAYAQSPETVAADAVEVQPTVICGVPRFYEKVYARVMEAAQTFAPLRRALFDWGLRQGRAIAATRFERRAPSAWLAVKAQIADRLVFSKIRARVGGRLRFCISGGAPLAPNVIEFFFAIGIPVYEGYGLTETSPVICLTPAERPKPGMVGPPLPGIELRIGDQGEILTRGPHVMKGYFNNPEATAQAIRDGWFHTGDIGEIDTDGYLRITDRLKELLVLAGGKKVAPQPIENRMKQNEWITDAVLIGDRRPFVSCLIVPNFARLEAEASARGWPAADRHALVEHPGVQAVMQETIDRINADLARFQQIKRFTLLERELSQEAGELTPSLKVKRRVIDERYAAVIEELYAGHTMPVAS
jgi:long-chain acyl-CoA synthetase